MQMCSHHTIDVNYPVLRHATNPKGTKATISSLVTKPSTELQWSWATICLHMGRQRRLGSPATILVNSSLGGIFVSFEILDFLRRHEFHHDVRLSLFKHKSKAFVGVIFLVCLILVSESVNVALEKRKA